MAITQKPLVRSVQNGKIWEQEFNTFKVKVYIPHCEEIGRIINFGYDAPCFLLINEKLFTDEEVIECSKKTGLENIARKLFTSVIFVTPNQTDSNLFAPIGFFEELISNIKIHQYYEDGIGILNNRFINKNEGFAIRGAIFRTCVIASGRAADYVAKNLLQVIQGDGLWGKADIAPTVCVLQNLCELPNICRKDMPIVSIDNTIEINSYIKRNTNHFIVKNTSLNPKNATYYSDESLFNLPNLENIFDSFIKKFIRWGWHGELFIEDDLQKKGLVEEYCVTNVKTSKDNCGDEQNTQSHDVGYICYYKRSLINKKKIPLLLCFHGGGDSAKHIAKVSNWKKVCYDNNFLLVCVENHINSTATEMMSLIEELKSKFNIDESRIYATGFSMGGCKTWDLFQEYADVFAALAPMDATFEVGQNLYANKSVGLHESGKINEDILVPLFYSAGEETPLPEFPFQEEKCFNRIKWVLTVNNCNFNEKLTFNAKDDWENKYYVYKQDKQKRVYDKERKSTLTLDYYKTKTDNQFYTVFTRVSGQGHECRYHTCKYAWDFMKRFSRVNGKILINKFIKF